MSKRFFPFRLSSNDRGAALRLLNPTGANGAQTDLSSLNLAGLQADLNSANTDWQALSSFCLTIAGIQYNTATPATVALPTAQQSRAA